MNSFFSLIKDSFKFCVKFKTPVLMGALIFTIVHFGFNYVRPVAPLPSDMEHMESQLEDLAALIEEGNPEAIETAMQELGMVGDRGDVGMEIVSSAMTPKLIGFVVLFAFALLVFGMISHTYFLVLAVDKVGSIGALFKRAFKLFVPLFLLGIWVFLRSFLWVPIVNIFTFIYYAPRFAFSGVIFVAEKRGIRESARESLVRTKGKWLKIVLNFVGFFLIVVIASSIIAGLVGLTGPATPYLLIFVNYIIVAYTAAFTVGLASVVASGVQPVIPSAKIDN